MNSEEQKILDGIKSGKETAYKQLFDDFYPQLSVFAKKYVQDLDVAKEIVQGIFVKLYEKRNSLTITKSIKSYLYQSVKNACLNYLKHIKIHQEHLEILNQQQKEYPDEWHDKMLETELQHKVFESISELPPKCSEIFTMSRTEGKSNSEIAEHLKISKRTVETQISKALKILREKLAPYLHLFLLITLSRTIFFCFFL